MKKIILLLSLLLLPMFATQAAATNDVMLRILQQTLAPDGHLTKEMHLEFWKNSKIAGKEELQKVLHVAKSQLPMKAYQKQLWESVRVSYQSRKVVKTQKFINLDKNIIDSFAKSLPYEKGSTLYHDNMAGFSEGMKATRENTKRLLEAAALHKPMQSVQGRTIDIDMNTIMTVINNMDASFKRAGKLFNPKWRND